MVCYLIKSLVQCRNFLKYILLRQLYWSTFCWNSFCFFYNFIAYNYWIVNNTSYIFTIFVTTCCRIPNTISLHARCSFGLSHIHRHSSLFHFWFKLHFLLSNLQSHLHNICFVNVFGSFIPVMIWKTCKFKSSVSFETHMDIN